MAENSKIEWTDATWTPIRARNKTTGRVGWHCEHATTGCVNCYAESFNLRLGTGLPFKPGHRQDIELFLDEEMLLAPLKWKKPRMIFVCSMSDLFADFVPDEWIHAIFAVAKLSRMHTFQALTKRSQRMREYMSARGTPVGVATHIAHIAAPAGSGYIAQIDVGKARATWPPENVWLGASAERQQEWDERTYHLSHTPAAVRFVSVEPMLGPIDGKVKQWPCRAAGTNCCGGNSVAEPLRGIAYCERAGADPIGKIDWVICGGESGPDARPMHPSWARDLRDQCDDAGGVPFFFKQWGAWAPDRKPKPNELVDARRELIVSREREVTSGLLAWGDDAVVMRRVGKGAAGRLLDGREWNEVPRMAETKGEQLRESLGHASTKTTAEIYEGQT